MTDTGRVGPLANRRAFLALVGSTGASALVGCVGGGSSGESAPGTTDPGRETGSGTGTQSETRATPGGESAGTPGSSTPAGPAGTAESNASSDGPVGSPPVPPTDDVARPTGDPGGLDVLDWAGFAGAVSYTFDDGQPSQVEHYGALQSTGVPMTFYVSANVDFEGAGAAWRRAAADGHEVGNHTVSHPRADLTGSSFGEPLESAAAEVEECSAYVTGTTDQREVWTMAAPFGDDGWSEYAREADLFLNRGVGGGAVPPGDGADPYNLPCYMARAGDTAEQFDGLVDAARSNGEWQILLFHSISPTDQEWYAPVHVDEVTGSAEYATSLADVWVDTVANVGAYWRGQRLVESAKPTTAGSETTWEWSVPDALPDGQHVRVTVDGGTPKQDGEALAWDSRGYYEVSLDAESLTLAP